MGTISFLITSTKPNGSRRQGGPQSKPRHAFSGAPLAPASNQSRTSTSDDLLPCLRRPGAAAAAGDPVACIEAARQKRRAATLAAAYARGRMTANTLRLILLAMAVLGLGSIADVTTTGYLERIQQDGHQLQRFYGGLQ